MAAVIIIGIIVLIIIINVSSNNRRQKEEAERQARLRQQRAEEERQARLRRERAVAEQLRKEEAERQARLRLERETAEKKRKEDENKRLDELYNETIIVVYESVGENNKPQAIVKRSNNTYASIERPSERFKISEKIRIAKEKINKWDWYDETTYQKKLSKKRQVDLLREQILEKLRIQNQYLDSFAIKYLYHMTHKDNLERILQSGLKSHNYARRNNLMQNDIANNEVNDRRSRIEPIYNRSLHDYVPLYFNPKNSMLFVRRNIQDNIIILALAKTFLSASLMAIFIILFFCKSK